MIEGMEELREFFKQWNAKSSEFAKLQHTYIVVAVIAVLLAGLTSLVNYRLGQSILFVAICAALVFIANGVVWAMLRTFILNHLQNSRRKK